MWVDRFIRVRWVYSGEVLVVVGFIPGGRWVHSCAPWGSLGSSFGRALGALVFIWVHSGAPLGSSGSPGLFEYSDGSWGSCRSLGSRTLGWSGSFVFVGIISRALWCAFWMVAFIWARPGSRRVHYCSLGSLGRALAVVGAHSGTPCGSSGSFRFGRALGGAGSIWSLPRHRRVHSDMLGSFARSLGVVGFFRVRWAHSCEP